MPTLNHATAEHIFLTWDAALSENNVEKLLVLYQPDATIESPLIPHIMGKAEGICRGAAEIRRFIELITQRKPPQRKYFKQNFFTNGKVLIWEYPHIAPSGQQMDFMEVMELNEGLIQKHRVYWGWYGVNILQTNQYWA